MTNKIGSLKAELEAIILWDRLYVDNPEPHAIERDACKARVFRRVQLIAELRALASRN